MTELPHARQFLPSQIALIDTRLSGNPLSTCVFLLFCDFFTSGAGLARLLMGNSASAAIAGT
jgi:hypothetical protein